MVILDHLAAIVAHGTAICKRITGIPIRSFSVGTAQPAPCTGVLAARTISAPSRYTDRKTSAPPSCIALPWRKKARWPQEHAAAWLVYGAPALPAARRSRAIADRPASAARSVRSAASEQTKVRKKLRLPSRMKLWRIRRSARFCWLLPLVAPAAAQTLRPYPAVQRICRKSVCCRDHLRKSDRRL